MSTDHELLDEVRAVLHDEVANVTAGPRMLAAVRRGRARRLVARRLALTGLVATAAAVAVVVAFPGGTPTSPPPRPVNAAHVMAKTSAALEGVLTDVVYERAIVTEGDKYSEPGEEALYERWLAPDGSSFRLRVTIAGRPVVDMSRDGVADVFVDYRAGTYRALPGVELSRSELPGVLTPEEIQQALTDGHLAVVGAGEPINGRATYMLHRGRGVIEVPVDLWVDAVTYLPVRWQLQQEGSAAFDVNWLPPTPENLANLATVIPPDFTPTT